MAKTIKTRIYDLPDMSSGYMMLDGGPGVECGKLHTNDLKAQVLYDAVNEELHLDFSPKQQQDNNT